MINQPSILIDEYQSTIQMKIRKITDNKRKINHGSLINHRSPENNEKLTQQIFSIQHPSELNISNGYKKTIEETT